MSLREATPHRNKVGAQAAAVGNKPYLFLMAALTNYHKHSSLKHKRIILQLWGSKVQHDVTGLKSKCGRAVCHAGSSAGEAVFLSLSASRGHSYSLAPGPVLHLQSQQCCMPLTWEGSPGKTQTQRWFRAP